MIILWRLHRKTEMKRSTQLWDRRTFWTFSTTFQAFFLWSHTRLIVYLRVCVIWLPVVKFHIMILVYNSWTWTLMYDSCWKKTLLCNSLHKNYYWGRHKDAVHKKHRLKFCHLRGFIQEFVVGMLKKVLMWFLKLFQDDFHDQ